jgi:uncharacterized protein with NAD-binding domain and iron-sulfur cluster
MVSLGGRRDSSRREFLRDAAVAGAAAAVATPSGALARRVAGVATRRRGKGVAVLGGGMAGLTAAHELIERGFDVTVYEPVRLGGKARSIPVPGSAGRGHRALPGEHGFRFFPGFYHHVPDSMRRIPVAGNDNGVWDNLVDTTEGLSARANGRPDALFLGMAYAPSEVLTVDGLRQILTEEILGGKGVRADELAYFVERLLVFVTSCDERRYGEWEKVAWWDFVGAETRSEEYQRIIARGLTRSLVAAKERLASTRTIGNMGEAFVMNIMGRGNDGALDRVLDAPTNEAWINPWVRHLKARGVRFELGQRVTGLALRGGEVTEAVVVDGRGRRRRVEADWFVSAMPAERARRLWTPAVLRADPALERMDELFVDWMVGIQYFLRERLDITHGHITFTDSPWALTALTQAQFWGERDFAATYGDGRAVDCLSVDVSDWDTPGLTTGKTAKRCTKGEIASEVWAQIEAHLTDRGEFELPPGIRHSWFLDPGVRWDRKRRRNRNATPLLVNTVGSWEMRPAAARKIPNLFLAGDYVQTDVDLATMEGANESARDAVIALLDRAGSNAEPPAKYRLYDPPEFEQLKAVDRELYRAGRPNALDVG